MAHGVRTAQCGVFLAFVDVGTLGSSVSSVSLGAGTSVTAVRVLATAVSFAVGCAFFAFVDVWWLRVGELGGY